MLGGTSGGGHLSPAPAHSHSQPGYLLQQPSLGYDPSNYYNFSTRAQHQQQQQHQHQPAQHKLLYSNAPGTTNLYDNLTKPLQSTNQQSQPQSQSRASSNKSSTTAKSEILDYADYASQFFDLGSTSTNSDDLLLLDSSQLMGGVGGGGGGGNSHKRHRTGVNSHSHTHGHNNYNSYNSNHNNMSSSNTNELENNKYQYQHQQRIQAKNDLLNAEINSFMNNHHKSQTHDKRDKRKAADISSSTSLPPLLPKQEQQHNKTLEGFTIKILSLSQEPLTASDIIETVRFRCQEVETRFLPCVEFLVRCQQDLRQGLEMTKDGRTRITPQQVGM